MIDGWFVDACDSFPQQPALGRVVGESDVLAINGREEDQEGEAKRMKAC